MRTTSTTQRPSAEEWHRATSDIQDDPARPTPLPPRPLPPRSQPSPRPEKFTGIRKHPWRTAVIGIISTLILAYFLSWPLIHFSNSQTTESPAPQATPRPPIQSPGSGDSVLPTITLAPLITNPLGGIPALGKHYEECNGKYEHILNQNARKQDFANKIKSGITLRQLQQFVTDECPLPATFNRNVPSNPQPNTHTAPPPVATATLTKTPTPTKTPGPIFSSINPQITIDQGNDQTSKAETGNERPGAFHFTGKALDNTEISLSDTIGTPTLLVFWSHW